MYVPVSANPESTAKHVQVARRAIRFRLDRSEFAVITRNAGTAAKGSTRKKIDVKAISENWRSGVTDLAVHRENHGRTLKITLIHHQYEIAIRGVGGHLEVDL